MSIHRRPGQTRRGARPSRSARIRAQSPGRMGGDLLVTDRLAIPGPQLNGAHPVQRPALARSVAATGLIGLFERHWPVMMVVLAFVASWTIIPIFTAAPVGDDWVYSLSVEYLLEEGRLEILDLSVTTLVFQVLWGSLFGLIFGDTFGAHRFSTVILFLLSGIAFYSLLRTLGVTYARSALGVAVYLFNPLSFVMAFSFMTDPVYLATMVISIAFYAAGMRIDQRNRKLILWGAFFAGCAFLVRQQGALIPFGIVAYLVLTRQLWFDRRSLVRFLEVVAIPATMLVLYYFWLIFIHGVPEQQDQFLDRALGAGIAGTWLLLRRMTYFETVVAGLFVLPIVLASLPGIIGLVRRRLLLRGEGLNRRVAALRLGAIAGWLVIVIFGAIVTVGNDYLMPYVSQFVGTSGLGPNDLFGGRPELLDPAAMADARLLLTWLCVGSAIVFGIATIGRIGSPATPQRGIAAMLTIVGLGQVAGVMPPSFHFANWIISVDRYLLPLLPFALALLLWALRDIRVALPIGWLALALFAAFSIVGTRDFLVFQKATWDYARYVNYDLGVPLTKLNGGSSWDGYYLHEYGDQNDIPQQTVGGTWWNNLFATATDSTYVISGSPNQPGDATYVQIDQREYSSWLMSKPVYLYVMQRQLIPPGQPPAGAIPPETPPPPIYAHPIQ